MCQTGPDTEGGRTAWMWHLQSVPGSFPFRSSLWHPVGRRSGLAPLPVLKPTPPTWGSLSDPSGSASSWGWAGRQAAPPLCPCRGLLLFLSVWVNLAWSVSTYTRHISQRRVSSTCPSAAVPLPPPWPLGPWSLSLHPLARYSHSGPPQVQI